MYSSFSSDDGTHSDLQLEKCTKFEPQAHHDFGFTIAFIVHLCGVLAWVGYCASDGSYHVLSKASENPKVVALLQGIAVPATTPEDNAHFAVTLAFTSTAIALVGAGAWLGLLYWWPAHVIYVALAFLPVMQAFLAVWAFVHGQIIAGVLFSLGSVMCIMYAIAVRDRIEFTAKLCRCVSLVYHRSPGIFAMALLIMVVNAIWTVVWLFAVVPLYVADKEALKSSAAHSEKPVSWVGWVVLLLSFYWTVQVTSNLLHVSCAGLMARWYFNYQMDAPVAHSISQVFKNYFGSICFGSLLIAIITTMRSLVRSAKEQAYQDGNIAGEICACCADMFLSCVEEFARIFNTFALVLVAIYSLPFYGAGRVAVALFERTGTELIISYSLVNIVNGFGCFAISAMVCAINAVVACCLNLDGVFVAGGAGLGFLSGFAVMCVLSRIVESGCDSLFVCFAQAPQQLQKSSRPLYEAFLERKTLCS